MFVISLHSLILCSYIILSVSFIPQTLLRGKSIVDQRAKTDSAITELFLLRKVFGFLGTGLSISTSLLFLSPSRSLSISLPPSYIYSIYLYSPFLAIMYVSVISAPFRRRGWCDCRGGRVNTRFWSIPSNPKRWYMPDAGWSYSANRRGMSWNSLQSPYVWLISGITYSNQGPFKRATDIHWHRYQLQYQHRVECVNCVWIFAYNYTISSEERCFI